MTHPENAELIRFQVFCWQTAADNRLELVTPIVMAIALITSGPNSVTKILNVMKTDIDALSSELEESLKSSLPKRRPKVVEHGVISLSEAGKEITRIANEVCQLMDDPAVGTHHILMALLKHDKFISTLFAKYGISLLKFRSVVKASLSSERTGGPRVNKKEKVSEGGPVDQPSASKPGINEKELLTKYCRNLTLMASQGKLDPVIGRDKEIARLVTTLGRRKKNNAILVGDPGVGKTAIVEGLAQRIVAGGVPEHIKTNQVFQLNMTAVVGKTTYRGQFEERMRAILELFASNKDYILFVDEMHTLIGAGGSVGGLDAANIMKPALSGGDVRCIGATTEEEYRRFFKKDGALDRRFQRIFVDEPSKDETIRILMGIRPVIEAHHGCSIPDETIKAAVELSIRHVPDRHLPDKAIDCLDEACSNAMSKSLSGEKVVVSKADIVGAIAVQTDMPEEIVGVSDINRAKSLSVFLKSKVIGQDKAIDTISTVLLGAYAGLKDPMKPIGCIVLGGPSGSGTTFVAEKMAEGLFDSDMSFIRINMSEFSEKFGNTRLIGSPPGYVGYGDKNQLTDKVSRRPYCLVLLDGVESAGEDVMRLFMQAMSKGVITDASGRDVSFRNAVIVMTMSFNATSKSSGLGFNDKVDGEASMADALSNECRKRFGDDFVNRVDEFVMFEELGIDDIRKVATLRIRDLSVRLCSLGISMTCTSGVIDEIISKSASGGRKPSVKDIDRYIRRDIESILSRTLADNEVPEPCLVVEVNDGKIVCSVVDINEGKTGCLADDFEESAPF